MKNSDIMQCKTYTPAKMKYPVLAQVKMNGIFGRWDSYSGRFYTRSGHVVNGLSVLEAEMQGLPDLDGELVVPGIEFFTMNGLIRNHSEVPACMFYVFDYPLAACADERFYEYTTIINSDQERLKHVKALKYHRCVDEQEATAFYNKVINAGYEGVVYKTIRAFYYDGKKWAVQKRVGQGSTECVITGFEEGKGMFVGKLGAFIVEYNGYPVKVGGGPGVTHEYREHVWANRDSFIGAKMKVSYKSITPNGSLQSPKFLGVRWDV